MSKRSARHTGEYSWEPLGRTAVCPYLGTNFCMMYCEYSEHLPDDCTFECIEWIESITAVCKHIKSCCCTRSSLPKPVTVPLAIGEDRWLLVDPQHAVHKTREQFEILYGYKPQVRIEDYTLNVVLVGPIRVNTR